MSKIKLAFCQLFMRYLLSVSISAFCLFFSMADRTLGLLTSILRYETLRQRGTSQFSTLSMQTNYVRRYSRDHAESEYVSHAGVNREGDEFIGNKQTTYSHTQKNIHTNTQLYTLVQKSASVGDIRPHSPSFCRSLRPRRSTDSVDPLWASRFLRLGSSDLEQSAT